MRPFSVRRDAVPLLVAAIVLALLSAVALKYYAAFALRAPLPDFHAFYCAGRSLLSHSDPYRLQPLASCEAPLLATYFPAGSTGVVIPAPLPPFAFALVLAFALLPFDAAAICWIAALLVAIVATAFTLRSLCGLSWLLVVVLVVCCDAASAIALGQLTPFAVLGVAASALALRRDKPVAAALWLLPVWLVPQSAIAGSAAMFLLVRRARPAVVLCIAGLFACGLLIGGWALTNEYAQAVVRAQVHAELPYAQQLALAPQLFQLGFAATGATIVGTLVWLAASLAGITLGGGARRIDEAFVVAVPCALALIGGVYLHPAALALALPAALLCAARSQTRVVGGIALALTAIPWMPSGITLFLCPLLALAVLLIASEIFQLDALGSIALAFAAFGLLVAIDAELLAHLTTLQAVVIQTDSTAFAQAAWDAIVRSPWAQPVTTGVWFARVCAAAGVVAIALAVGKLRESFAAAASRRT